MVTLVPRMVLVMVVSFRIFENPKSAIFATPLCNRMLAVLKSLCIAPTSCIPTNPLSICLRNYLASSSESLFLTFKYSSISFPLQYSVKMKTYLDVENESMYLMTLSLWHFFNTIISVCTNSLSLGVSIISFLAITLP